MLCLRPETWPETARYPTHVTLLPLLAAILLAALLAASGQIYRQIQSLSQFAATYDRYYPPLEINGDGVLSAQGELKAPIRVPVFGRWVLVDPTGKTNPETIEWGNVTGVINDHQLVNFNPFTGRLSSQALSEWFKPPYGFLHPPKQGETQVIAGGNIQAAVQDGIPVFVFLGLCWAGLQALAEAAWVAAILFLMSPVVMLAAAGAPGHAVAPSRALLLPRRVALRMVAGFLLPLVLLDGILRAAGHPIADVLGWNGSMFFWFIAALALSIWTGLMAKRMYGAKR